MFRYFEGKNHSPQKGQDGSCLPVFKKILHKISLHLRNSLRRRYSTTQRTIFFFGYKYKGKESKNTKHKN